jgi:hypothetical protein
MTKNKNIHRPRSILMQGGAVVAFFLAVALLTQLSGVATVLAAADSTLLFDPAGSSVTVGADFTLDARLDPGANQVTAVALRVTFDQTKLRLDSITPSAAFPLVLASAIISNTNGTASIDVAVNTGAPTVTVPSSVAVFAFHALATATDSPVAFTTASIVAAHGEAGNALLTRTPAAVTVTVADTTAPTITSITSTTANGSYNASDSINVTVNFSEAVTSTGNVTVTLETGATDRTCTFTVSNASAGTCNYIVQAGDTSADLTVNTIAGTIADQAANPMTNFVPATNLAAGKAIIIDTTAPTVAQVTAVAVVSRSTTPSYVFSATEAGTITLAGGCTSATTSATSGNNTLTFSTMARATSYSCTVTVTDTAGNASNVFTIPTFAVTYASDLNADRTVNPLDYNVLHANYNSTTPGNTADMNADNIVNVLDYNILHSEYGGAF